MTTAQGPYQHCRPLTDDEYAALKADIEQHGVMEYVHVDESGAILVGHHRARVAAELGIEYPRHVVTGLSEREKHAYAVRLESLGRARDMETKRWTALDLWDTEGLKLKQKDIAELVGVGTATITRWIKERDAERAAEAERNSARNFAPGGPERVENARGEQRPRTYATKPKEPETDSAPESPAATAPLPFEMPEEERESDEERAYYALTRQLLLVRFDPEAVADSAGYPGDALASFDELAAWFERFMTRLRTNAGRSLRRVE